jgi:hypothetical protein
MRKKNAKHELTSPRRINLTRRATSRGGLTLCELFNRFEFISSVECCI